VHVTVVVPAWNVDPEAGLHVTVPMPGQLSVAVGGVKLTTAEQTPGSLFAPTFA